LNKLFTTNGYSPRSSSLRNNKLEPYVYLRYLFANLPQAETVEAIEELLPGNIDKDQIRLE
jgi:hypothetical protein